MYVTISKGFFKEEGLEIDLFTGTEQMQRIQKHKFLYNKIINPYNPIAIHNS